MGADYALQLLVQERVFNDEFATQLPWRQLWCDIARRVMHFFVVAQPAGESKSTLDDEAFL